MAGDRKREIPLSLTDRSQWDRCKYETDTDQCGI
jgi:hypothetical protein